MVGAVHDEAIDCFTPIALYLTKTKSDKQTTEKSTISKQNNVMAAVMRSFVFDVGRCRSPIVGKLLNDRFKYAIIRKCNTKVCKSLSLWNRLLLTLFYMCLVSMYFMIS